MSGDQGGDPVETVCERIGSLFGMKASSLYAMATDLKIVESIETSLEPANHMVMVNNVRAAKALNTIRSIVKDKRRVPYHLVFAAGDYVHTKYGSLGLPLVDLTVEWKKANFLEGVRENACVSIIAKGGALVMEPFDAYEWLLGKIVMLSCTIWHNALAGDMSGLSALIGDSVEGRHFAPGPIKTPVSGSIKGPIKTHVSAPVSGPIKAPFSGQVHATKVVPFVSKREKPEPLVSFVPPSMDALQRPSSPYMYGMRPGIQAPIDFSKHLPNVTHQFAQDFLKTFGSDVAEKKYRSIVVLEYTHHLAANWIESCAVTLGMNVIRFRENNRGPYEYDMKFLQNWFKSGYQSFHSSDQKNYPRAMKDRWNSILLQPFVVILLEPSETIIDKQTLGQLLQKKMARVAFSPIALETMMNYYLGTWQRIHEYIQVQALNMSFYRYNRFGIQMAETSSEMTETRDKAPIEMTETRDKAPIEMTGDKAPIYMTETRAETQMAKETKKKASVQKSDDDEFKDWQIKAGIDPDYVPSQDESNRMIEAYTKFLMTNEIVPFTFDTRHETTKPMELPFLPDCTSLDMPDREDKLETIRSLLSEKVSRIDTSVGALNVSSLERFVSPRAWFNDENIFLFGQRLEANFVHMMCLDSIGFTSYPDRYRMTATKTLVCLPVNVNEDHWILLYWSQDTEKLYLYDSLNQVRTPFELTRLQSWLISQGKRVDSIVHEEASGTWHQKDKVNCGVFVAYKMFSLAQQGQCIIDDIRQAREDIMLWTLYGFEGDDLISFEKPTREEAEDVRVLSPDSSEEPSVFSSRSPSPSASSSQSPRLASRSPSPSSSPSPSDLSSLESDDEPISMDKVPSASSSPPPRLASRSPSAFSSPPPRPASKSPSAFSSPSPRPTSRSPSAFSSPSPRPASRSPSPSLVSDDEPLVLDESLPSMPMMIAQPMTQPFGGQDSIRMYLNDRTTVIMFCSKSNVAIGRSIKAYLDSIYVANVLASDEQGDTTVSSLVAEYKKMSKTSRVSTVDTSQLVANLRQLDLDIQEKTRAMATQPLNRDRFKKDISLLRSRRTTIEKKLNLQQSNLSKSLQNDLMLIQLSDDNDILKIFMVKTGVAGIATSILFSQAELIPTWMHGSRVQVTVPVSNGTIALVGLLQPTLVESSFDVSKSGNASQATTDCLPSINYEATESSLTKIASQKTNGSVGKIPVEVIRSLMPPNDWNEKIFDMLMQMVENASNGTVIGVSGQVYANTIRMNLTPARVNAAHRVIVWVRRSNGERAVIIIDRQRQTGRIYGVGPLQGNESDLMQAFTMICSQMYVTPQPPFALDAQVENAIALSCNLVAACIYFAYKGDVDGCLALSAWAGMFLHVYVWLTSGFESTQIITEDIERPVERPVERPIEKALSPVRPIAKRAKETQVTSAPLIVSAPAPSAPAAHVAPVPVPVVPSAPAPSALATSAPVAPVRVAPAAPAASLVSTMAMTSLLDSLGVEWILVVMERKHNDQYNAYIQIIKQLQEHIVLITVGVDRKKNDKAHDIYTVDGFRQEQARLTSQPFVLINLASSPQDVANQIMSSPSCRAIASRLVPSDPNLVPSGPLELGKIVLSVYSRASMDMQPTSVSPPSTVSSYLDATQNCLPTIDDATADLCDMLFEMDPTGKSNLMIRGVPLHVIHSLMGAWDPVVFNSLATLFTQSSNGAVYIDLVDRVESNTLVSIKAGGIIQSIMPESLPILLVAKTIVLWTVRARGDKMVGVIDKSRNRISLISTFVDGFNQADRAFGNAVESLAKYLVAQTSPLSVFDYSYLSEEFSDTDPINASNQLLASVMYFSYKGDLHGCLEFSVDDDNHWIDIEYATAMWLMYGVGQMTIDPETAQIITTLARGTTAPVPLTPAKLAETPAPKEIIRPASSSTETKLSSPTPARLPETPAPKEIIRPASSSTETELSSPTPSPTPVELPAPKEIIRPASLSPASSEGRLSEESGTLSPESVLSDSSMSEVDEPFVATAPTPAATPVDTRLIRPVPRRPNGQAPVWQRPLRQTPVAPSVSASVAPSRSLSVAPSVSASVAPSRSLSVVSEARDVGQVLDSILTPNVRSALADTIGAVTRETIQSIAGTLPLAQTQGIMTRMQQPLFEHDEKRKMFESIKRSGYQKFLEEFVKISNKRPSPQDKYEPMVRAVNRVITATNRKQPSRSRESIFVNLDWMNDMMPDLIEQQNRVDTLRMRRAQRLDTHRVAPVLPSLQGQPSQTSRAVSEKSSGAQSSSSSETFSRSNAPMDETLQVPDCNFALAQIQEISSILQTINLQQIPNLSYAPVLKKSILDEMARITTMDSLESLLEEHKQAFVSSLPSLFAVQTNITMTETCVAMLKQMLDAYRHLKLLNSVLDRMEALRQPSKRAEVGQEILQAYVDEILGLVDSLRAGNVRRAFIVLMAPMTIDIALRPENVTQQFESSVYEEQRRQTLQHILMGINTVIEQFLSFCTAIDTLRAEMGSVTSSNVLVNIYNQGQLAINNYAEAMHSYDPLYRVDPALKRVLDQQPLAALRSHQGIVDQLLEQSQWQSQAVPLGSNGLMTQSTQAQQTIDRQQQDYQKQFENARREVQMQKTMAPVDFPEEEEEVEYLGTIPAEDENRPALPIAVKQEPESSRQIAQPTEHVEEERPSSALRRSPRIAAMAKSKRK